MENNENTNAQIPEEFKTFLEWVSIVTDTFADLSTSITPKVITKGGTGSLGVVLDTLEGKSWDQIIGKTIGTVIDTWLIQKVGSAVKTTKLTTNIIKGVSEGRVVLELGQTEYSAASYFEKAFPTAVNFYSTLYDDVVNGDGSYAQLIWEGIKGMSDTDQFMNYYKNITFDQFMNDLSDLFNPTYTIPTSNTSIVIQDNKITITTMDTENVTSILKTLYPILDTPFNDVYFVGNITSTGEQLSVTKTISPDTQKATYTLTASDIENTSAVIGSVLGMIKGSAIDSSKVVIEITDTNLKTTIEQGDLLYDLGTKSSVDLYSMLKNNPWLIDESNIVLSNQHFELTGLEASISSLESALNSQNVSIVEDVSGKFNTIKADGNTFVITDHGQIIQYDVMTSKVFVVTGQYTESSYTITSSTPISDELLGSIAQSLSTSSSTTLPNNFDGVVTLTKEGSSNTITLSSLKNSDGVLVGTLKTIQEEGVQTITQSFNDTSLPVQTTVITDDFTATFSNNVFQGFSSVGNVAISEGFNQLFLENLHVKELAVPSLEEIKQLNLNDTTTNTNAIKEAYDTTVESSVSVTDYYGTPKLITQTEATLQTIGTGIASLTDALSLIKAIQSGQPLPIGR